MRTGVVLGLILLVAACSLGCGQPTGKNINRGKDKPTPPAEKDS